MWWQFGGWTHKNDGRRIKEDDRALPVLFARRQRESSFQTIELFLRAVRRSRNVGRPRMFRVGLDGLDDQVEFVGAVDLPDMQ